MAGRWYPDDRAQLGAEVTVVDTDGIGGSAVLTDCVPSKTLIATAEVMTLVDESVELGVRFPGGAGSSREPEGSVCVELGAVNRRVRTLALAQSDDQLGDQGGVLRRAFHQG